MTPWHEYSVQAVLQELRCDAETGLSDAEVAQRRVQYGPNELENDRPKSAWWIFFDQLTPILVVILIAAAVVSLLLGDHREAIAIAAIIVLNALLGFTQEYRAETALAALKRLTVPAVRVRRDAKIHEIAAAGLVPGDILLLEAGNFIAADCRIIESVALETQESTLTGESQPIHKSVQPLEPANLPAADRRNMAYLGTFVVAGRGEAVVVATAMHTELGRIAQIIQGVRHEETPLQRRLQQLGKRLAAAALFLVTVIFLLGLLRGNGFQVMLLTAVSIAVAAVPEGLPAVVTIALTLGTQRMLRRKALIRKLPAVETLGSVTVICSDKTGTLTQNHLAVTGLRTSTGWLEMGGAAGAPPRRPDETFRDTGFGLLLAAGVLCNDALLPENQKEPDGPLPLGDPTEVALLAAAVEFGLAKQPLQAVLPRIAELPFTPERKRMTTVHAPRPAIGAIPLEITASLARDAASTIAFTKGGVESLLELSTSVWVNGRIEPLTQSWRERLLAGHDELAASGARILGVAFRTLGPAWDPTAIGDLENNLTFVGMFGMMDPPRAEAASAIKTCETAGIRVVMITGDHALTAQSIARQLGLGAAHATTITGADIDRFSVAERELRAQTTDIYARVSPEHKLLIVEALQRHGHVVAMTGDGVNDAPALKKAAIGVAMGRTGTDVAKESADMVLLDDNFATIVAAIEEGRVIYDNIRKFVRYILATNTAEIWIMLLAPFSGMPLPLLPLQILWMNLATDGLPALALSAEPAEADIMRRPPHHPKESIFARGMGRHVIWVGLLMAAISFASGFWYWRAGRSDWQTMLFTTLTLSQMAHILAIRTERASLFQVGLFSNAPLLGAVLLTVLLQAAIVQLPILQATFNTVGLSRQDWTLSALLSSLVFLAVELEKWCFRRPLAATPPAPAD
jgi:P-type Ca2+ transporter type 2C